MDEMSNLSELFEKQVRENTLREILLLIQECETIEELKKKIEEKLYNK